MIYMTTTSASKRLIDVTEDDGIAVMTLQREPVNSLNMEIVQVMSNLLDEISKNKPKGLILTSALPTIFCAGLDINEFYNPDMKRAESFFAVIEDVWIKLFGFPYVTAAAINGHSPGAGCLLALSCEYRAMVKGKYTIGLNETALGTFAHTWVMDTMCHTIHVRVAEMALTTSKRFSAEEAVKVGMVDDTAISKSEAVNKCKEFIRKFDNIPTYARTLTKQRIREATLKKMKAVRERDSIAVRKLLKNPDFQKGIEIYLQELRHKTTSS